MRKFGRVDLNQHQIVQDLRDTGHSVTLLSTVGDGCPDLLIGRGGVNILAEVKLPGGKDDLTDDQLDWHSKWRGQAIIIRTTEDAINAVNEAIRKQGGAV